MPNDHMNGHGGPPAQAPSPDQVRSLKDQIDAALAMTVTSMIRGMLGSMPQVPPELVLESIVRITGKATAQAIMGDLGPVLKIRAAFKDEFAKAMSGEPIVPVPQAPSARQKLQG